MERLLKKYITKDLDKKMVFITGARQVGKTWLAKDISKNFKNTLYLNWDELEDRKVILNKTWLNNIDLLILDEIHKMPKWKNYLKGLYDTKSENLKILVTGSARLDTFRKTGDSLAGRFFSYRLNPITLFEIKNYKESVEDFLIENSGFPEPFLSKDIDYNNRWRKNYIDGLIRTDILDFENIHNLKTFETLFELLRFRVGSPVSYKSIAQDLNIAPNTVKKYIEILEALYIVFRLTPYSKNIARSILKEPKLYFYDLGLVKGDIGVKYENYVALSILSQIQFYEDIKGQKTKLHYLRTKERKEIDFVIAVEDEIKYFIEAKLTETRIDKSLKYFKEKYNIPSIQLVKNLRTEHIKEDIKILNSSRFLSSDILNP